MATALAEMALARAAGGGVRGGGGNKKRESLSVVPVKPAAAAGMEKPERLDRTQGIQDSDYRVHGAGASPIKARPAVPLDVFDYEQLERVEFLASGAFSHVFSAQYRGKSVVVKLLREQYKESHVTLKQMRFEQTLLSQLHHPNIVEFVGTGVYNGVPFTVLERLDETLNQRISGEAKLTLLESLGYAKAIGEALVYLHEEALPGQVTLHRDLKPDNLAFSQGTGAIKLIDFGLARSVPRGASIDEVYEMTGETGSLRYSECPHTARPRGEGGGCVHAGGRGVGAGVAWVLLWMDD
jgi:tRNA A-37 threonylcarbamoyl transferase component Bud32